MRGCLFGIYTVIMRSLIGIFVISLLAPAAASASGIRHMEYSHPSEFAKCLARPAFIICDNCPNRKAPTLVHRASLPAIAIRVSAPVYPKPSSPNSPTLQKESTEKLRPLEVENPFSLTVYFDFDSFSLHSEERDKLRTAPSLFKSNVAVTGYTCDIGSDEYNRRLSLKRAEAVAAQLRIIGVAPLVITGKGKCCPVSNNKELNRRVEIKEAR